MHSALITVSMPNEQINKQNKQLNISKYSVHIKYRQIVYGKETLVTGFLKVVQNDTIVIK